MDLKTNAPSDKFFLTQRQQKILKHMFYTYRQYKFEFGWNNQRLKNKSKPKDSVNAFKQHDKIPLIC